MTGTCTRCGRDREIYNHARMLCQSCYKKARSLGELSDAIKCSRCGNVTRKGRTICYRCKPFQENNCKLIRVKRCMDCGKEFTEGSSFRCDEGGGVMLWVERCQACIDAGWERFKRLGHRGHLSDETIRELESRSYQRG